MLERDPGGFTAPAAEGCSGEGEVVCSIGSFTGLRG